MKKHNAKNQKQKRGTRTQGGGFAQHAESLKTLRFISGPVSITYHPDVAGRDFFIFGDRHRATDATGFEGGCEYVFSCDRGDCFFMVEIADFLDRVFQKTPKRTDFYLELPFRMRRAPDATMTNPGFDIEDPREAIFRIWKKFRNCFLREKTEPCRQKYPNVRFHYSDIRTQVFEEPKVESSAAASDEDTKPSDSSNQHLHNFFMRYRARLQEIHRTLDIVPERYLRSYLRKISGIISIIDSANALESALKDYLRLSHKGWTTKYPDNWLAKYKISEDLWVQFWESKATRGENRIRKQLEAVSDPMIRQRLIEYDDDRVMELVRGYEDVPVEITRGWLRALKNGNTESLKSALTRKSTILLMANAHQMDMYTLGRIFRKSLEDGEQVWLYAGNLHAEAVRTFLREYLGYNDSYSAEPIALRCQDADRIRREIDERERRTGIRPPLQLLLSQIPGENISGSLGSLTTPEGLVATMQPGESSGSNGGDSADGDGHDGDYDYDDDWNLYAI